MRLLFIGGTSFIGRHAVELAVGDGHEVTVFHRGRTNPGLLAGKIDHRLGDRDAGDYASIDEGVWWDAVIDVCAYVPRHVHQLRQQLLDAIYGCQPFRTMLRDLGLTSNQVWGSPRPTTSGRQRSRQR